MRHCVRCQAQRHSAWYAAKACPVLNRTQRDPFAKVLSGSAQAFCGLVAARAGSVAAPPSFFGRRLSVEAMSLAPMCCELARFSWPSCRRLPAYPVRDCVPAPPSKSITGGVVTSQTRPRRKQPPEIIMDLGGHPCREVSDALREAVAANQSKRVKETAAKSWRGDGDLSTLFQ